MAFYSEMRAMVRDLLKPDTQGGLGQGEIALVRVTPGTPDPAKPWEPVNSTTTKQAVKGAVRGVSQRMIGTEVNGTIILASDREAVCEVPSIAYQAGDVLQIDGRPVTVLSYSNIPAAGTPAAVRFIVRG